MRLVARAAVFVIASPIIACIWGGALVYAAWKTVVIGEPPRG